MHKDHASLQMGVQMSHLSKRMAHWLSNFEEYSFVVLYKPGLGLKHTVVTAVNPLCVDIANAYRNESFYSSIVDYCINPSPDGLRKLTISTHPSRAQPGR